MYLGSPLMLLLAPGWPLASALAVEPPSRPPYRFENVAPVRKQERPFTYELNLRARWVRLPDAFLDNFYHDSDDEGWPYVEDRPQATAQAYGFEVVNRWKHASAISYVEVIDSTMQGGYWDTREDPADFLDGEYLEPTALFGGIGGGINYAYAAPLVKPAQTRGALGLAFVFSTGLGLAVRTGKLERWRQDDLGNPAYKLFLDGREPGDPARLPPVFPLVDLAAGLRFDLGERAVIRAEGGLHSALYFGLAAGVSF